MLRAILLMAFLSVSAHSQTPCQSELNGFLLGQHKKALSQLGPPFKTGKDNDWQFQAYKLSDDGYMVFEFDPRQPEQIAAIQISGQVPGMYPFLGIKLGDSEQNLIARLGRPAAKKMEEDQEVFLVEYAGRNYTFEVSKAGLISSIRIVNDCQEDYPGKPTVPDGSPLIEELTRALATRNVDLLMELLAPDIEVYKSGTAYTFSRAARVELEKGDTEFSRLLFAPQGSVLSVLKQHPRQDAQIRVYEKHAAAHVVKFPGSKVIAEIVFSYQNGRWKVYEIKFL